MMMGTVMPWLEAQVRLTLHGADDRSVEVQAVVDTGFSAELTLPGAAIEGLELRQCGEDRVTLADGSVALTEVYDCTITWGGRQRGVIVHRAESSPLIGMALLHAHLLSMEVLRHGRVTISRMP